MAKLETVARLLGCAPCKVRHHHGLWMFNYDEHGGILSCKTCGFSARSDPHFAPPAYDTDANASRELLAYVKAQGRETPFGGNILRIVAPILNIGAFPVARVFELLSATPQQIYAAFCATFACELEQVEKQS